jgi:hypothetical protein
VSYLHLEGRAKTESQGVQAFTIYPSVDGQCQEFCEKLKVVRFGALKKGNRRFNLDPSP